MKITFIRNKILIFKYFLEHLAHVEHGCDYIISSIIQLILSVLFSFVITLVPGMIINELTSNREVKTLGMLIALLVIIPILRCFSEMTLSLHIRKIHSLLYCKFDEKFLNFVADMDYSSLENPKIAIMKDQVAEVVASVPMDAFDMILRFASSFIRILFLASLVVMLNPLIMILILFVIFINSKITKIINKKKFEKNKIIKEKEHIKWAHFYDLTGEKSAKEMRLFHCKEYLINNVIECERELIEARHNQNKYETRLRFIQTLVGISHTAAVYIYSVISVLNDTIAVGSMTIFISAAEQFASALNEIVSVYLDFGRMFPFWKDTLDFLAIPNRKMKSGNLMPEFTEKSVLEFKNVSFQYPGSDQYAVRNLNLKIYGNQKLCIVGENGTGKTTFIKLLLRLYDPTDGEILLNGISIDCYEFLEYQKMFTSVFQDYSMYNLSLEKNISLSKNSDNNRVEKAISNSGLSSFVKELPHGIKTSILKNINDDGVVPSGGEGQKIAIARALYHGGEIMILDEPTAALDPMAEYDIYMQFSNMITDKCAILITHRLSAVQLADKIAVFDDGHIAEYGTHKELYANGGIYTEMFDKQAQFYRDENNTTDNT